MTDSTPKNPRPSGPTTKPPASKNDPAKADRLTQQLRANLRKRKQQTRGRKTSPLPTPEPHDPNG